jgi:hypothetical protein
MTKGIALTGKGLQALKNKKEKYAAIWPPYRGGFAAKCAKD